MSSTRSVTHRPGMSYRFELARSPQDIRAYFNLRTAIFCHEQHLFMGDDQDDIDAIAYPIVALAESIHPELSSPDSQPPDSSLPNVQCPIPNTQHPIPNSQHSTPNTQIVGVVRIYETQPRLWYGGRLGVHADYRRVGRIGKGLINKAVTTANTWGCDRFLATVQLQNVRFFKRLHWESIDEIVVCDRPHHLMEADLNFYPPGHELRPDVVGGDRKVS